LPTPQSPIGELAVFLSSTFVDLQPYRQKVEEFLLRIEAVFRSMKYFGSKEGEPLEYCLEQLRKCNFYIGIIGHRYGSVHEEKALSITELEYEEAKRIGMNRCIYIAIASLPVSAEHIEPDSKRKLLELFKQKLMKENTVLMFTSPEDLALKVASDLLSRVTEKASITSFSRKKYLPAMRRVSGQISFLGLDIQAMKRHRDVKLEKVHVHSKFSETGEPSELGEGKRVRRPQSLRWSEIGERESLTLPQMLGRSNSAVILGDPGSGKSTLAKYLAVAAIDKLPPCTQLLKNLVPMRIPLRAYAEFRQRVTLGANILDFLRASAKGELQLDTIPEGFFEYYLGRREALLIFDGLDEIFDANLREQARNDIIIFTQVSFPGNRVVITSRKNGYEETAFNPSEFAHFNVEPFDKGQISEYIDKWYRMEEADKKKRESEIAGLTHACNNLPNDLLRNPLLLSLIVILFRSGCSLPESKLEIYRSCVGTLTEKWDAAGKRLDLPERFNLVKDKKNAFARLAFWMYTQLSLGARAQRRIKYEDILGELTRYLCDREFRGREDAAHEAAECFLEYAAKRSIFVEDKFSHKTFHEYFAALYLYRNFCVGHTLDELYKQIQPYLGIDYWAVVLELLLLILDEQSGPVAENLLSRILDDVRPDPAREHRLLVLPLQAVWQMQNIGPEYVERVVAAALGICMAAPLANPWEVELEKEEPHHRIFNALRETAPRSIAILNRQLNHAAASTQDPSVLLRITAFCAEFGHQQELDASQLVPTWEAVSKDLCARHPEVFNLVFRHSSFNTRISEFTNIYGTEKIVQPYRYVFRTNMRGLPLADFCLLILNSLHDIEAYDVAIGQVLDSPACNVLLGYWINGTGTQNNRLYLHLGSALRHLVREDKRPEKYLIDWLILYLVTATRWTFRGASRQIRHSARILAQKGNPAQAFYAKLLLKQRAETPPKEALGLTEPIHETLVRACDRIAQLSLKVGAAARAR